MQLLLFGIVLQWSHLNYYYNIIPTKQPIFICGNIPKAPSMIPWYYTYWDVPIPGTRHHTIYHTCWAMPIYQVLDAIPWHHTYWAMPIYQVAGMIPWYYTYWCQYIPGTRCHTMVSYPLGNANIPGTRYYTIYVLENANIYQVLGIMPWYHTY